MRTREVRLWDSRKLSSSVSSVSLGTSSGWVRHQCATTAPNNWLAWSWPWQCYALMYVSESHVLQSVFVCDLTYIICSVCVWYVDIGVWHIWIDVLRASETLWSFLASVWLDGQPDPPRAQTLSLHIPAISWVTRSQGILEYKWPQVYWGLLSSHFWQS